MKEIIDAIYENGVLRPLRKLSMSEGQRLRLTVEPTGAEPVDGEGPAARGGYDFSDLIGRLSWKGDPVAEQRRLRDEWE